MNESLIQILMAGLGTAGFAIYFHIRLRNLPAAVIGGVIGWVVYLLAEHLTNSILLSSLFAAFIVCIWSEIMARVIKAPVNVFMIPGLIPIIPGSGLYQTMRAMVNKDSAALSDRGTYTGLTLIGLAVGIVAASVIFVYYRDISKAAKDRKARKHVKS